MSHLQSAVQWPLPRARPPTTRGRITDKATPAGWDVAPRRAGSQGAHGWGLWSGSTSGAQAGRSARRRGLGEKGVDLLGTAEESDAVAAAQDGVRRRVEDHALPADDRDHGDAEPLADPCLAQRLIGDAAG